MPLFGGPKLEDILITLRMQEKTLEREAKRAEKEHNALKAKVKKAIAEQRIEFAQSGGSEPLDFVSFIK